MTDTGFGDPGADALREVFAATANPMILFDDDLRYVDVNEAACELLGRSREELLGRSFGELTPPDLWATVEPTFRRFRREGFEAGTWTIRRGDGTRYELEYSATANVLPGRHLAVILVRPPSAAERGQLTPREREVLGLVAEGWTTRETAERLGISPATVDSHIVNAMERVGARNRTHLIALALSRGAVSLQDGDGAAS